MSNPTSNFGWQMPTPTDLVTDLPADFEVFGQAVDSTMADLKGGTTGQMLTKATNTDMDFTWITPQIGDITAITATSPLTGGGTTGDVTVGIQAASTSQSGAVQLTDSTSSTSTTTAATPNSVKSSYDLANAAVPKSTVTTKGDLIGATASATVARLGVGTNGQVLTADSAASTGLAWTTPTSGSMTVLANGSLSGSSLNLTSISGSYKSLYLVLDAYSLTAAGSVTLRVNSDSGTNYNYVYIGSENGTFRNAQLLTQGVVDLLANGSYSCASGNNKNLLVVSIPNYASANTGKVIETFNTWLASTALTRALMKSFISYTGTNAAISTVTIGTSSTFNGGTYTLYGVN